MKFLIIGSNNENEDHLNVKKELNIIKDLVHESNQNITIKIEYNATVNDIIKKLNDFKPNLLHFAGHSKKSAIALKDGILDNKALSTILSNINGNYPDYVIFNSCNSENLLYSIIPYIECGIGMDNPISDQLAQQFTETFYTSFLSQGENHNFEQAFNMTKTLINSRQAYDSHEVNPKFLRNEIPAGNYVIQNTNIPRVFDIAWEKLLYTFGCHMRGNQEFEIKHIRLGKYSIRLKMKEKAFLSYGNFSTHNLSSKFGIRQTLPSNLSDKEKFIFKKTSRQGVYTIKSCYTNEYLMLPEKETFDNKYENSPNPPVAYYHGVNLCLSNNYSGEPNKEWYLLRR